MGYAAHWSGAIRIEPPLTWAEIKNSKQSPGFQDAKLRLDEKIEDTDTGQVRTITADAIVPATSEAINGYDMLDEIQATVDAHPEHTFSGAIEARPEDPGGDPWRYVVQGRRVVRQVPVMIWPGEDADRALARQIVENLEERSQREASVAQMAPERSMYATGVRDAARMARNMLIQTTDGQESK